MDTIEKCPENTWNNEHAYWHIVYHALYYTDLYFSQSPDKFIPWAKHRENYQYLSSVTRDNKPLIIESIYPKNEMLEYAESIFKKCEKSVNETNLEDKSGFDWLPMSKLGVHLYNLRHLQHHIGQLIAQLHQAGIRGVKWEKSG